MKKTGVNVKAIKALALLYFLSVIYITLLSGKRYEGNFEDGNLSLIPLSAQWVYLSRFWEIYPHERLFVIKELGGNFLLFMPFPWAFYTVTKKSLRKRYLLSVIAFTVLTIESLQYVLRIGMFDIDDIILNTTGGLVGIYLFEALHKKYNT